MSFSRDNFNYKSLPINRPSYEFKTVNFTMPKNQPQQQSQLNDETIPSKKTEPVINTEEFAKLDALLQDLLAEVDQPILLNKENSRPSIPKSFSVNRSNKLDEIERSVDWLNEQKEILRSRKETSNFTTTSQLGDSIQTRKLNYFISNSNENPSISNVTSSSTLKQDLSNNSNLNDMTTSVAKETFVQIPIINNKPPVSPNSRNLYSPTQVPVQTNTNNQNFNSISNNSTLLKNITETDDELNIIDSELERFSQKSYKSGVNTLQRSKYHIVSNDFTECTRATPVPILNKQIQNKRACSAPPTQAGKVVLQRMELKSPLTVRQGSVIPFEQQQMQQPQVYPITNEQIIQQRMQTPVNYPTSNTYNNRGLVRENNLHATHQQVPARSVFLNRAYSETPRIAYTNGYETDSGLVSNNIYNYRNGSTMQNRVYTQAKPNIVDSDVEGYTTNGYRIGEAHNYRYGNTGVNAYRTLGPNTRYQVINDQSGYDTDTGLIKLRQVLDNRRTPISNGVPIQTNSYILQNRSMTPSFNYHYNQLTPQQQQQTFRHYNNSQSNINQIPISDQFGSQYVMSSYPSNNENEFIQQQVNDFGFVENIDPRQQLIEQNIEQKQNVPQSIIIQQQVAPSAYLPRDTPSRLGMSSSASNLSTTLQKQQSQQSQQLQREDSRQGLINSLPTDEVIRDHPKYVKVNQSYWYKPKISRDEAITILKDKAPGTFLIRDSNNFPGAYGLALKVDKPPQNVQIKPGTDPANELVRHFLIEPTTKGVRIKGCCNEPVFGSLAALVYHHSLMQLALPLKLILPTQDLATKTSEKQSNKNSNNIDPRQLLQKGAACNVYFLNSFNVENKNGFEAITYALNHTKAFKNKDSSELLLIQFKVTSQGITLTDLNQKKFLRQHFPTNTVVYCAVDEKLHWPQKLDKIQKPKIFGVVCKPKVNTGTNECHLFVELDPEQPAIAIVDFINRYLIPSKTLK